MMDSQIKGNNMYCNSSRMLAYDQVGCASMSRLWSQWKTKWCLRRSTSMPHLYGIVSCKTWVYSTEFQNDYHSCPFCFYCAQNEGRTQCDHASTECVCSRNAISVSSRCKSRASRMCFCLQASFCPKFNFIWSVWSAGSCIYWQGWTEMGHIISWKSELIKSPLNPSI